MNLFRALLLSFPLTLSAQDWSFSGSLENTLWVGGDRPPAFLEFDDGFFYEPSLALSLDYLPNDSFYLHATARADRGFDPGTEPSGDYRLDELILRYRPFADRRLSLQAGKFPSVIGNWIPNHQFYDDPFLLPPLPYGAVNGLAVNNPQGNSPQGIQNRARSGTNFIHETKDLWSSIIWGPAYSNGISVSGNQGKIDYALEIKNSGLGSQPEEWDFGKGDFSTPTISGRFGLRPNAAWNFGFSASHGFYLNTSASDVLPPGIFRNDFTQTLLGLDLRWASRDWIISGEAFFTSYETLDEDLESFSYYLQARYKAAPGIWIAARFGQTLSNEVSVPSGGQEPWTPDYIRAELAVGWRITPETLLKGQYAYTEVTNNLSSPSPHLLGMSFGWQF